MRQTAPGTGNPGQFVLYLIVIIVSAAALLLLFMALRQRRLTQRARVMRRLLDGADALESQLLECRARMQQLRTMLVALPEEMSAVANSALDDDKVQAGLRDLLAHRLWIKQHAGSASQHELTTACAAIEQSYQVMQSQLARLDAITGELAAAQLSARSVGARGKNGAA